MKQGAEINICKALSKGSILILNNISSILNKNLLLMELLHSNRSLMARGWEFIILSLQVLMHPCITSAKNIFQ